MRIRAAWSRLSPDGKALVVVSILLALTMVGIYLGLKAMMEGWTIVLGNPG